MGGRREVVRPCGGYKRVRRIMLMMWVSDTPPLRWWRRNGGVGAPNRKGRVTDLISGI